MPRVMASAASSGGVQCVTGRPDAPGCSQASAMIEQITSALNFTGVPERGSSEKVASISRRRSAVLHDAASRALSRGATASQRVRQVRAIEERRKIVQQAEATDRPPADVLDQAVAR